MIIGQKTRRKSVVFFYHFGIVMFLLPVNVHIYYHFIQGMEEILNCFLKDDNPDMTRQIQFIIQQLNSGNSNDDAISSVICVLFNTVMYISQDKANMLLNLLYLWSQYCLQKVDFCHIPK